ncbi:MAG: GNAT family N-acetyltransferase [Verrucomicrobia bacterium]|nr:GNAT family N-acetyltransferase [Verrucomicrobiota bacterium]
MNFRSIEFGSDAYRKECALRDAVLRAPLGRSLYDEELASEKQQKHFGLFDDAGHLVACVIAVPLSPTEAKIRQMAVSMAHQKQGCGRQIIRSLEEHLAGSGHVHLSMHARASAVGFYEKLGYTKVGPEFMEVGIPHFRMEKRLTLYGNEALRSR